MDEWKIELTQEAIEDPKGAIHALIEAANNICADSQQDFQALKDTKWYKRLWDLITFSKDNEKKIARGVANLAKLQEIVMKALLLLLGHSAETAEIAKQNSIVLDELSKKLAATKNTQVGIIREIERIKNGVSTSLSFDETSTDTKLIIVNALLKIKDALPVKSDLGEDYLSAMMNAAHCTSSDIQSSINYEYIGDFKNKESQLIYSMAMEYIFLSTGNFECDSEIVGYINIGPQKREAICKQIKCIAALRDGEKLLLNRFKDDEAYSFVTEGDMEWLFYEEDVLEEEEPEEAPQKEDVYIANLTQIRSGDSLKFVDKNVYIQANVDCHGELMFLDCNVFYNCGEAIGKITLSPGAELNVCDSHVLGGAYDDTAFIRGKQADINCTNSTFRNCNNFIDAETSEIYMDKCGVYNCVSKFICTKVDYMSGVGQSQITNTLIVIDDPQALELAKEHKCSIAYIFDIQRCEYKNNLFYYPAISSDTPWIILFDGNSQQVEKCTFVMSGDQHVSCANNSKHVSNCLFVGGNGVVSLDGSSNLSNSMFIGCKNAVACGKDTIKECTFVDCLDTTIEAKFRGSTVIEGCTFMNTKVVTKKQKGKYEDEIPCIKLYCDREFMEKGTNQPNQVNSCTFYHLNNYNYIIAPAAVGKPEETIAVIKDCHFANCDCEKAIKTDVHYYSEVLSIQKTVRDVMKVINPEGVDLYGWRSGSGKTISRNEVNVDLTETPYGCEYLTSVSYLNNGLVSDEKLRPWIADFEQRIIAEVE